MILAIVKVCLFPIAGIGQSVMKRGSESDLDPATFFGGGLAYGAVYALAIGAIVATVFAVAPTLLQYGPAIVAGAFAVFASRIFYMLLLDTYRSRGKTGFATLTDNAHGIVETGAQVAFLLAGFGVIGLLAGTALTTMVVALVVLWASEVSVERPSVATLRSIADFAQWSVVTSGLGTIYDRLPVLILGTFLGEAVAGYYTSAMRLLMLGSYVGGSIAPALMVRVSAVSSDGNADSSLDDFRLSTAYAAVLAIPIMFGSLAIPDALMVTVFGPTFSGTGAVLAVLSLYHVVNTYDTIADSFFDGSDRPDLSMKTRTVALAVRVALIVTLLPRFGITAVTVAVVISHIVDLSIVALLLRSEFGRIAAPTRVAYQLGSGVIMWGIVNYLADSYPITGWLSLLAVVGVGAVVYVSLMFVLDEYLRHAAIDIGRDTLRTLVGTS
ncbi:oligosaccharide flippase family protein [Haloplanus vescus]|uniref:oligosaccharide flippase family protein n=1 Tax=Haloplanus vescus TaxID=555874 RepID=UPI0015A23F55|nr:polysaccharide biosynthesis C-terminal domain-containing protein [Haloplanus vescus]